MEMPNTGRHSLKIASNSWYFRTFHTPKIRLLLTHPAWHIRGSFLSGSTSTPPLLLLLSITASDPYLELICSDHQLQKLVFCPFTRF